MHATPRHDAALACTCEDAALPCPQGRGEPMLCTPFGRGQSGAPTRARTRVAPPAAHQRAINKHGIARTCTLCRLLVRMGAGTGEAADSRICVGLDWSSHVSHPPCDRARQRLRGLPSPLPPPPENSSPVIAVCLALGAGSAPCRRGPPCALGTRGSSICNGWRVKVTTGTYGAALARDSAAPVWVQRVVAVLAPPLVRGPWHERCRACGRAGLGGWGAVWAWCVGGTWAPVPRAEGGGGGVGCTTNRPPHTAQIPRPGGCPAPCTRVPTRHFTLLSTHGQGPLIRTWVLRCVRACVLACSWRPASPPPQQGPLRPRG
jgi:hypothetical protein